MVEKSSLRMELYHFGFSDKEVDTYLALLRLGESKTADIASKADVSKRYVYEVMERFEDRNYVYINDHKKPTTITPLEPTEVVEQLNERLESLQSNLEARYTDTGKQEAHSFEAIKSERTVHKRLSSLVQNAKEELIISIPENYFEIIRSDLRDAVNDNVFVLLFIYNVSEQNRLEDLKGMGNAVRLWDEISSLLLIADNQYELYRPTMVTNPPNNNDILTVMTTCKYFHQLMHPAFFSSGWELGDEVHVEPPLELPHTYNNFRHGLFDAMMYYRRGETVIADLRIRPTRTHESFETKTGEIVDIKQGIVKPGSGAIPMQQSLVVNSNDETFTVSGINGFLEDYECINMELRLK